MSTAVVERAIVPTSSPLRRWHRLYPWLAILGGSAAIGWQASNYGWWIIDDAGITFAYSRSISEGFGPVLQPGAEPVEGYSNPTWTILLVIARLLGLFDRGTLFGVPDYAFFPKALALILCAGILTACYFAAKRVTRWPSLTTFAVGLTLAAIPSFIIWCFSGLENPLYALIVVVQATILFSAIIKNKLLTKKIALAAGALAAAAALTRPEGLIYAGVYPLVVLVRLRRNDILNALKQVAISTATFAVPVGAYFIWRYFEFGRLLSNPSIAKQQKTPELENFTTSETLVQYIGVLLVILVLLVIGMTLSRASQFRSALTALLVPLGLAVLAYSVMIPDWMSFYRFATPIWVLGALTAVLAVAETLRQVRIRGRILLSVGLIAVLIPSVDHLHGPEVAVFQRGGDVPMCYIAERFGRAPNVYADILQLEQASLLLPDLGGSSLTSRLTLIDMAGLTNKRIADFIHDSDGPGLRNYVFDEIKPTFIHSRGPWAAGNGISTDPRIERDYEEIYRYRHHAPPYGGDWVRKDAIRSPELLAQARAYMNSPNVPGEGPGRFDNDAGSTCGDVLRPGQAPVR